MAKGWPWPVLFSSFELEDTCSGCKKSRQSIVVYDADGIEGALCYPCLLRDGGIGMRFRAAA